MLRIQLIILSRCRCIDLKYIVMSLLLISFSEIKSQHTPFHNEPVHQLNVKFVNRTDFQIDSLTFKGHKIGPIVAGSESDFIPLESVSIYNNHWNESTKAFTTGRSFRTLGPRSGWCGTGYSSIAEGHFTAEISLTNYTDSLGQPYLTLFLKKAP